MLKSRLDVHMFMWYLSFLLSSLSDLIVSAAYWFFQNQFSLSARDIPSPTYGSSQLGPNVSILRPVSYQEEGAQVRTYISSTYVCTCVCKCNYIKREKEIVINVHTYVFTYIRMCVCWIIRIHASMFLSNFSRVCRCMCRRHVCTICTMHWTLLGSTSFMYICVCTARVPNLSTLLSRSCVLLLSTQPCSSATMLTLSRC